MKFVVQENLDTEWKFTRTRIWLSWIYKDYVLPPPFNILYLLLPIRWLITHLGEVCCPENLASNTSYKIESLNRIHGALVPRRLL